jgi:hypothetical protein
MTSPAPDARPRAAAEPQAGGLLPLGLRFEHAFTPFSRF